MKFRFCGDGDCPDWVLAEIHSTLSVLSSVKVRSLCKILALDILGEEAIPDDIVTYIFTAHSFGRTEAKSAMAALKFIISNAVRYRVTTEVFNNELQQLGLPKEHSNAICQQFDEYFHKISQRQLKAMLSVSQFRQIRMERADTEEFRNIQLTTQWEVTVKSVRDTNEHNLTIRNEDLKVLVSELEIARKLMGRYCGNDQC